MAEFTGKTFENPQNGDWYGPLLEIEWTLTIHINCIFPYYGKCMEIVGKYTPRIKFSDAIENSIWISLFFPVVSKQTLLTIASFRCFLHISKGYY